ncbi:N-6 DNA methylase [Bacillus zhangzhouensis]|uniref:DNA methyltransferase n=1 Tax=Bacillus zhangzhouensis TaxID=1178540 RepID=A0A081LG29_9BACI|nr:class I SAM-dependent methyltransferase [Bacillus zhangzhouensis]KEP28205.1 DNA methyltransferase [Bacillus zhangzhouensis]
MKLKAQNSAQKLRGGYYTPKELTDFIVKWALHNEQTTTVFEPSCGDGAFLESLSVHPRISQLKCLAVELDEEEAKKAKVRVENCPNLDVINADFYNVYEEKKDSLFGTQQRFDAIVGNPPYIRYQYLTAAQRETQSDILVSNGMKSNKLINSWVSFVVACVELLNDNGKIGLVIPAELLQVAYAEDLRLFLVNNLSRTTVITFKELVFPDVQQEVVILLGEKDKDKLSTSKSTIRVIEWQNTDFLNEEEVFRTPINYQRAMQDKDKWTKYFLEPEEANLIYQIQQDERFVAFSDIADVDIGITTGNNEYFSVNKNVVEEYELQNVVRPLIGRSSHASGLYFTEQDWLGNVNKGTAAHLIDFPNIPYEEYLEGHKAYIRRGEEEEAHTGYKCSIRERWYRVPSIWVPDAFFLRRNNTFPKFVLNDINAVSTDTMHRVKFNEGINREKVLLSYYNSITFAFTEIEGRSYGGGVLEILPGEVEKVMLPNLQSLNSEIVEDLIVKIDRTIRAKKDIEPILDEIDQLVLRDHLGIEEETILSFRIIWKKLMNRRLSRKHKRKGKAKL